MKRRMMENILRAAALGMLLAAGTLLQPLEVLAAEEAEAESILEEAPAELPEEAALEQQQEPAAEEVFVEPAPEPAEVPEPEEPAEPAGEEAAPETESVQEQAETADFPEAVTPDPPLSEATAECEASEELTEETAEAEKAPEEAVTPAVFEAADEVQTAEEVPAAEADSPMPAEETSQPDEAPGMNEVPGVNEAPGMNEAPSVSETAHVNDCSEGILFSDPASGESYMYFTGTGEWVRVVPVDGSGNYTQAPPDLPPVERPLEVHREYRCVSCVQAVAESGGAPLQEWTLTLAEGLVAPEIEGYDFQCVTYNDDKVWRFHNRTEQGEVVREEAEDENGYCIRQTRTDVVHTIAIRLDGSQVDVPETPTVVFHYEKEEPEE